MGSDVTAEVAYLKARMATEIPVNTTGGVYLTVRDEDKDGLIPVALQLGELGLKIYATPGTAHVLRDGGVDCEIAYRIAEGKSPDALGLMRRGEIQFIVNVPTISGGAVRDGNMMRRVWRWRRFALLDWARLPLNACLLNIWTVAGFEDTRETLASTIQKVILFYSVYQVSRRETPDYRLVTRRTLETALRVFSRRRKHR